MEKCSINLAVPHGFILDPTLFLTYIYDLPNDAICTIVISDVPSALNSVRILNCGNDLN